MPFDLVTIGKAVGVAKQAKDLLGWLTQGGRRRWSMRRARKKESSAFLAVVPETGSGRPIWNLGSVGGAPAMQLSGHFWVTNVSGRRLLLVRADVLKPDGSPYCDCVVLTSDPDEVRREFSRYELPPGFAVQALITAFGQPPLGTPGCDFTTQVVFVDNFARRHTIEVRFVPH